MYRLFLVIAMSVFGVSGLAPTKVVPVEEAVTTNSGIIPTVTRHRATPIVETIEAVPAADATGSPSLSNVALFSTCIRAVSLFPQSVKRRGNSTSVSIANGASYANRR
jgi:hypothetical protein